MTIDELADGLTRMTDEEIAGFLSSQNVGVLALPTSGAPSMRPLSFWFDGDATLYFLYVLADDSHKAALSAHADAARFLVYSAETRFNWQSVLLTGTVEPVPETDRDAVADAIDLRWRPDAFARASETESTGLYRFLVDEQTGIKQVDLPPGFEAGTPDG
jgi:hypothetical protein